MQVGQEFAAWNKMCFPALQNMLGFGTIQLSTISRRRSAIEKLPCNCWLPTAVDQAPKCIVLVALGAAAMTLVYAPQKTSWTIAFAMVPFKAGK